MNSYLITISPLEPYFFGSERSLGFGKVKGNLKQRYFISSQDVPSQTTLLGALRYAVLAANGALITDFSKGSLERERANELIGPVSFDFQHKNSFGAIGRIHPLFILDGENYLVPMPMNHKNSFAVGSGNTASYECYTPMRLDQCQESITLSTGDLFSPDYAAKHGCGCGWLNLTDGSSVSSRYDPEQDSGLFQSIMRVGINSHRTETAENRNDAESYFKKEYKLLRQGVFAFFAELDPDRVQGLERGTLIYMGQNKSAFQIKAVKKENDLNEKIAGTLSEYAVNDFWYAPGDCHFEQEYSGYVIANTQLFRHLITTTGNHYYDRFKKSEKLYRLLNAGAVFYGRRPDFANDEIARVIGMNELVEIRKGDGNYGC